MLKNIFLSLLFVLIPTTVAIILNIFRDKKNLLDKRYAIKAIIAFGICMLLLTILDMI